MVSAFNLKLRHGTQLTAADEEILAGLTRTVTAARPRRDITREGGEVRFLPIIVDGWACRYRLRNDGKRQITAVYLPGDLCEPFGVLPRFLDCTIAALSPVSAAFTSPGAIKSAALSSPRIEEALWWDLLVASSIDQERLVSLGRRSAAERLGHFFCEIYLRLRMVGLADKSQYDLRMTQADLSDLLGLTPVHVNRSLRHLRETGLITLEGQRLVIHNLDQLQEMSDFDPAYLHANLSPGGNPLSRFERAPNRR